MNKYFSVSGSKGVRSQEVFPLLVLTKTVLLSGRFCRIEWELKGKNLEKYNDF